MYKKQIVVIVIVVIITGYLYTLPVKGLIKPEQADGHTNTTATQKRPVANVTVEMVSVASKAIIGQALATQISNTEGQLKNAGGGVQKLSLQKQLAKRWDDVNQAAPAAFYYQAIALEENTFDSWSKAGSRFNDAYSAVQDTVQQPAFVNNAIDCYTNALKLQPANLDAKTGLGVAYVNGFSLGIGQDGGGPPKGVVLLLEVVQQDPKNINANLNLGKFAVTSHQYEKAVERFKTVIAQKAMPDAYFYLAESYKQLGMKKEAIDAYQKCRAIVTDAAFDKQIDEYIKELKN
ncbi:MAG TPA: tetratricopeptide repeat protein [Mucilaginibacter sp.]|jgi:tetratricopeptide (TPR) repeat protein|nr:tetratricopeptide repeat protein [Mucilaginibacter sp.]